MLASLDYFSPKEPRGAGYPERKARPDAKRTAHGEGERKSSARAAHVTARGNGRRRATAKGEGPCQSEMATRPILMFDSGIGGLTVLREARVLMPDRRFVYVADDAAFPYGDWEEPALSAHILALFGELLERFEPEIAVIACNTASTLVIDDLARGLIPATPFVGTVPAIKPAAERTRSGLVSVLATPGTVKRQYTRDLISQLGVEMPCPAGRQRRSLARLAEAYMRDGFVDEEAVRAEIAPCFIEHEGGRTDIVVLACTHYPFLANRMRKTAPWPVDWIDPGRGDRAARACRCWRQPLDGTIAQHLTGSRHRGFHVGQGGFPDAAADAGFGLSLV